MTATVIKLRNPRQRRRELLRTFCQCVGLASIVLVMNYGALLGGGSDVRMHVPFALVGICLAQLMDIFLVALLLFAILGSLQRTRAYPVVRLLVAILVPPYVLFRLQDLIPFASQDGLITIVFIVWGGLLLVLYLRYNLWFRKLVQLGDGLSIFLFLFAVCSMLQILLVTLWKPGPYQHVASWAGANQPPRTHARVVWLVFDELSYDQTFGHRAHDLELPNFDKLRGEATLYSNVQPIGAKTVKIIPSLLTGHVVDDVRFGFNNRFKVHYVGVHGWHPLDGSQTIFADAQKQGWRTAAVGWYNPYCTIYAGAIDDCYWMNHDRTDGDMAQGDGFWRNTYSPLASMVREVKSPERDDRDSCTYDVRQRLKTDLDLEQHVQQELAADQSDFVFIHMPVPHSPNIWSREEDNYTTFCDSSYLDNLALADRILGHVLTQLEASPRWKDTTFIVQGDHSWRMYLWNYLPAWTSEDDAISRGGFNPHPAMLIHRAGQTSGLMDSSPWPVVNIHDVVEQILRAGR